MEAVRSEALALVGAVLDDPVAAARRARALRADATDDPESLSAVHRVLAIAATALQRAEEAAGHALASVRVAEAAQLHQRAAEARMSLVLPLLALGRPDEALAEVTGAVEALRGLPRARAQAQRALVLLRLQRTDEALALFRRAVTVLRRHGDATWEAIARCNRGVVHVYRRDWHAADSDLRHAIALAERAGARHVAASARHNLGYLAAWRSDVPGALAAYDAAGAAMRELGLDRGLLQMDRAETLLSAGLVAEAREAAQAAVAELVASRMEADLAEARLTLAEALLADGDPEEALAEATRAREAFAAQRRDAWEVLGRYVQLRAREAGGARDTGGARDEGGPRDEGGALDTGLGSPDAGGPRDEGGARDAGLGSRDSGGLRDEAARVAAALDAAGWPVQAAEARLIAARAALAGGRPDAARRALEEAAGFRQRGPAALRARAWHAEALRRASEGDRRGAYAAAHAGLRVLDGYQAAIGASELRAGVGGQAAGLSGFGLALALEEGRARRVLAWAERGRSRALRTRPVRPPQDAALADDLTSLRAAAAELEDAALGGRDTTALRRALARLEQSVRRRAQHARGAGSAALASPPGLDGLDAALGERALVEFVHHDGRLHALVVAGGRARLRRLGQAGEPERELAALRFALRRLARGHGSPASLAAAEASAGHAAARLDALLLAPLGRLLGDRELVLVPTGALHATPWSLLPSCAGRATSVAPSASAWLRASRARPATSGTVLVGADTPPHAGREVGALAELYPGAARLLAAGATAAAVTAGLDGAALAHVACHGHFRADNPQFSHLRLADGPLTVYDLERLRESPHCLVLSACESGLSGVAPGDELMGLAASLLALGTSTLVASVVPVADEATRLLMVDFHQRLCGGRSPAAALAGAQQAAGGGHAAAGGFVCFGAG